MKLRIKIGTMPVQVVSAPRIRHVPAVGQLVEVREGQAGKLSTVLVDQVKNINGVALFYASRM